MTITDRLRWFGKKPTVKVAEGGGKQVTITTSTTEILAANEARTSFTLIVRGSKNVFIELGTTAIPADPELEPGEGLSSDDYTGAISGIVVDGNGRVDVFEV